LLSADDLSKRDRLIIRAFALKVRYYLTDSTFEKLSFVFASSLLPGWKETRSRVVFISGLDPVIYDCCPNSCCCFVGPHASLTGCPYCDTPQCDAEGRPRKI